MSDYSDVIVIQFQEKSTYKDMHNWTVNMFNLKKVLLDFYLQEKDKKVFVFTCLTVFIIWN